ERYLLVFNAGSSSLKFELFDCRHGLESCVRGAVTDIGRSQSTFAIDGREAEERPSVAGAGEAAALVLDRLHEGVDGIRLLGGSVLATGHRVVHGGEHFSAPVRVTVSAFDRLKSLAP